VTVNFINCFLFFIGKRSTQTLTTIHGYKEG